MESVSYENPPVLEATQDEAYGSNTETSDAEKVFPRLDGEVTPLVAANADVIVRCHWMGGAEVSVSTAMRNYYMPMSEEIADQIISDIYELLANQVTEPEEQEAEENSEEDAEKTEEIDEKANTKEEPPKPPIKSDKSKVEKPAIPQTEASKPIEQPGVKAQKIAAVQTAKTVLAKPEIKATPTNNEAKQPIQDIPVAEVAPSIKVDNVATAEAQADTTMSTPESISTEPVAGETYQAPSTPDFESSQPQPAVSTAVEAEPAMDSPDFLSVPMAEAYTVPTEAEDIVIPEAAEQPPLDIESLATTDVEFELIDEINIAEDDWALVPGEHQALTESQTEFDEAIFYERLHDADQETVEEFIDFSAPSIELVAGTLSVEDELTSPSISPELSELQPQLTPTPEQLIPISLGVEGIEDTLNQLAEHIEASEPPTAELVNEILDKIIEVPAKIHEQDYENIITETEVQEELEELFARLFDTMGIDYTPELIECLAKLTLNWQLADEIQQLKDETPADKVAQDTGTHEIIKKLLAGLSWIKKAILHACAIGSSALRLCSPSLAIV